MQVFRSLLPFVVFLLVPGLRCREDTQFVQQDRVGRGQLPSRYMVNLYRGLQKAERGSKAQEPHGPEADIIRSVEAKSILQMGDRWILTFDLSFLNQEEEMQLAELRLRWADFAGPQHPGNKIAIDIFHQQETLCDRKDSMDQEHLYLGSLSASPHTPRSSGWNLLDSTKLLMDASKLPCFKRTLATGALMGPNIRKKQITPSPTPANRQDGQSKHQTMVNQVLMVVFSTLSKERHVSTSSSLLQVAEHSKYTTQRMPLANDEQESTPPPEKMKRLRRNKKLKDRISGVRKISQESDSRPLCRKVDFYVDFDEIGWGSWIVHPKRYNAYRCDGKCPSPLGEHFQPTNHAYMQSLLKLYIPERVPSPCCSPVRTGPLSLLYQEDGQVVVHHHEEMIVEECGCL
ncbi:nodal homolog [Ambystoma mexicanum]|uniref:nodal homolog n=1 Tax=Ambystoma mexicanum TaxID=8296 RepID=UPI0037E82774